MIEFCGIKFKSDGVKHEFTVDSIKVIGFY